MNENTIIAKLKKSGVSVYTFNSNLSKEGYHVLNQWVVGKEYESPLGLRSALLTPAVTMRDKTGSAIQHLAKALTLQGRAPVSILNHLAMLSALNAFETDNNMLIPTEAINHRGRGFILLPHLFADNSVTIWGWRDVRRIGNFLQDHILEGGSVITCAPGHPKDETLQALGEEWPSLYADAFQKFSI